MRDPFAPPLMYWVRHGYTEENEDRIFRGLADYPLNDDGVAAAEEAANFLSFRTIGRVSSSTALRTVQTATIIAQDFDRNPLLLCWNIGDFDGLPRSKYQKDFQRYIDDRDLVIPNGESLNQFFQIKEQVLNQYIAEASYSQPPVLVTHSSTIRAFAELTRPDLYEYDDDNLVLPGGIIAVYLGQNGVFEIEPVLGEVLTEQDARVS